MKNTRRSLRNASHMRAVMNDAEQLAIILGELEHREKNLVLDFPPQQRFVEDTSQFVSALCTRRAGKTNGLALRFYRTMVRYPGSLSRYIALTRDSAKDIMWPVLQEMDATHGWNASFTESNLTMTLPNGAKLRLMGADMKNFVRRLRGAKSPAVAVDEAQEFETSHLENLVENVLTPTLADYGSDSWLALTGTPGPIPRGLFYDSTLGGAGYSVHKWTCYQNPYLKDITAFVERLKAKKKWTDQTPAYVREWLGRWVLDLESLLVRYNETENGYHTLPPGKYDFIMGIDLGFNDADAIAVIGWSESSKTSYLVHECIVKGQELSPLVQQVIDLGRRFDVSKMIIDEGGLGKKIAEELRRRHHIPVQAADKKRKMENVALLNDALRTGMFKASPESQFAIDSYQLQIDHEKTTPDRIVVKKGFHSDIIDAVLYAFKESPAFTYQQPKTKPKYGTKSWFDNEVTEMEEKAQEYFEALEQAEKGYGVG